MLTRRRRTHSVIRMTWNISASGNKVSAVESVKNASAPHFSDEQAAEKADYERAKQHVLDKLAGAPDEADVSVSCSGHGTLRDGKNVGSSESMTISYWVPEGAKADEPKPGQ